MYLTQHSAPRVKTFALKSLYSCVVLAGLSSYAYADGTTLDTLVVQGSWLGSADEEEVKVYPGSRDLVTEEELHDRGALHLEDALRGTPSLQILDETGTGILPNIGIRGLNPLRSERVQFLVDGYPIAIGPYTNVGVSLFPITLPSVESVDIVRGGAAVHYGPNNVGGVINLHTRPIPHDTKQTISERLVVAEETGNVFNDTYYRIGGKASDDLALQFQANIQSGAGARDHSDTDVSNFILDAQYLTGPDSDISAQLQYYDVDAELPGALSPAAYKEDPSQSQRLHDAYKADMLRGTLTWTYTPSDNVELQWRNFAHRANRAFYFGQRFGTDDHWADPAKESTHVSNTPRLFKVYGTEPRLNVRQDNHNIILGARYVSETVEDDFYREVLASGEYFQVDDWHFETQATALYASDSISLLDDRLTITPGIRYETVKTDFDNYATGEGDKNDVDEVLPGLTVGYQATERLFLFSNAQRSLVPVQSSQVTREGELANETAWNYEVGARMQATQDLSTSVTLFRIDHEDQIQFDRELSTFVNFGETQSQGVELEANWQATDNLAVNFSYGYLDTEQRSGDNQGKELPNSPHHHVGAEAVYHYDAWQTSLSGYYVSRSFSDGANTVEETANGSAGELPAYTLVNARIARSIQLDQDSELQLSLAVNNLLDEEYYFRGADVTPVGRVPASGRAFVVEGVLNF